jgi:hypothetical protein
LGTNNLIPFPSVNSKTILNNFYFEKKKKLIKKLGEQFIYDNMPRLHAQESRLTREKALNRFCVELSGDDCPFNVHLHTVSKHKDELPGSICLGVSPSGLLVFEMRHAAEINLISTFHWCSVIKLNADVSSFI